MENTIRVGFISDFQTSQIKMFERSENVVIKDGEVYIKKSDLPSNIKDAS